MWEAVFVVSDFVCFLTATDRYSYKVEFIARMYMHTKQKSEK